ncbi:MAG: adenylate/guanylate cyclase domain-containing protein [Coraliomargarita sp.]
MSLMRTLVLLTSVISIAVLIVMSLGARNAVRELSSQLIGQSTDNAEQGLRDFFHHMEGLTRITSSWSQNSLIQYDDEDALLRFNRIFTPALIENPHVTSMMLANDDGFEYMILRDFEGNEAYDWLNRVTWAERDSSESFYAEWDANLQLLKSYPMKGAEHYDTRTRPYFQLPTTDKSHWTDPYYFYTTRDAGMTVSRKWTDPSGQVRVVAFDLMLMDLSRFTVDQHPTPNGRVFVLSKDYAMVGLPADGRWATPTERREVLRNPEERHGKRTRADKAAALRTPAELDLPVIATAVDALHGKGTEAAEHFRLKVTNQYWWCGLRRFDLNGTELWIGVVAPESDFIGDAVKQRNIVLAISGMTIMLSVFIAIQSARSYSFPLEKLAKETQRIRELNLTRKPPVQSRIREINQLEDASKQMMTALESFSKYVPIDLVRQLLHRGDVARIGGKVENLTILFTDIEGFTDIAEGMQPAELTKHMANYFDAMLEVLLEEGATVDKFIGDAIVAFWGAPIPNEQHAQHGVRALIRCRERLSELNTKWQQEGLPPLKTRFGMASGEVVVGNIGSHNRLDYTVLGDTVNLASRLESLNARYGTQILVAESATRETKDSFLWREIDWVSVKGKTETIRIFEPLCACEAITRELEQQKQRYEEAFKHYVKGDFPRAAELLELLLESTPEDGPAAYLLKRCKELERHPPETTWDGVTRFKTK